MYISALFKKMLAYSETLSPKTTFILSAKYGLLKLDDVIEPYEQHLKKLPIAMRRTWAKGVIDSLGQEADLKSDTFIFLAGNDYTKLLLPHIISYTLPMEGLRSGYRLQWLDKQVK